MRSEQLAVRLSKHERKQITAAAALEETRPSTLLRTIGLSWAQERLANDAVDRLDAKELAAMNGGS